MNFRNLKKELSSPETWRKVQFYIKYKSSKEFNGKFPKEDFLPITIVLLLAATCIVVAVVVAIKIAF